VTCGAVPLNSGKDILISRRKSLTDFIHNAPSDAAHIKTGHNAVVVRETKWAVQVLQPTLLLLLGRAREVFEYIRDPFASDCSKWVAFDTRDSLTEVGLIRTPGLEQPDRKAKLIEDRGCGAACEPDVASGCRQSTG